MWQLSSAGSPAKNLIDPEKYAVHPVYIAQNGEMYTGEPLRDTAFFRGGLSDKKCPRALLSGGKLYAVRGRKLKEVCAIDCALNCCHGMNGEDGAVAGLLRLNRIPDASPDMAASAVFMDKGMTKLIAKALNIPAPAFFRISEAEYKKRGAMAIKCIEERLGYPVIVKPARLGSSIGVAVAEDRAKLAFAIEAGFAYDTVLIAEKYLSDRREINKSTFPTAARSTVPPTARGTKSSFPPARSRKRTTNSSPSATSTWARGNSARATFPPKFPKRAPSVSAAIQSFCTAA